MDKLLVSLMTFWNDITGKNEKEKGATMVEYGIMVAAIAVVVMVVAFTLGGQIRDFFQDIIDRLGAAPA